MCRKIFCVLHTLANTDNFFCQSADNWQHMTLDKDIRNIVETVIENDLAAPKVPKRRVPKLKRTWSCDHAPDFLYGHRIGYYKGLAEGIMLERRGRQLTKDEDIEIFEIVEPYSRGLRKYFAYYKNKIR